MNHNDHVRLLQAGVPARGGVWADFGAGSGAFTLALADLLGDATIHSVERDARALQEQKRAMRQRFPAATLIAHQADFTRPLPLPLPPLDGLVMANALHFYRDKAPILALLRAYLKPGGVFILVEYNVDVGNTWVPYPLAYPTWAALGQRSGFANVRLLHTVPSRFLREIYSAACERPADDDAPAAL